jgi:hypothetical protein
VLNPHFHDMLSAFNAEGVEYLIVGAYAMAGHGYPRATGDLDFWIRRSPENADRVLRALNAFGAPPGFVTHGDLLTAGMVAQLGVEPSRIDILTSIDGVEFDEAYPERSEIALDGLRVPFVGVRHLIQNKRATGREKDKLDVSRLEAVASRRSTQSPGPKPRKPKR